MNEKLQAKLKDLPKDPGVYFHKDSHGEIIYIGKAANLRNRVRQYFQASRVRDPKTDALVSEIVDTDWTVLETELDALFVEAEMIRRYMPRYNILLRDDKSFIYVRIDTHSSHPTVSYTRRPLDDGAEYFGPYLSKQGISRALKYLRKAFPYSTHSPTNIPKRACLQAQLGLCPGLEAHLTSLDEYRQNLRQLMMYLRGSRKTITVQIEKAMTAQAKAHNFEEASKLRNKLYALKNLERQVIFGDRELMDISKDNGLLRLEKLLGLPAPPRRIEGFDISHLQGTDNVASMVVFVAGVPNKGQYRKFKLRIGGNDDFAHMREVITRRLQPRNVKAWGLPELLLIDGGKGQVSAAQGAVQALGYQIPMIGLAKRHEEIIVPKSIGQFEVLQLPKNDDGLKLLMRIRDESHRFAVSYHSTIRKQRQTASQLDDIPGIGPATRKALIKHFGSTKSLNLATEEEVAKVVGKSKAKLITSQRSSV
jgi:excinuclease ABC subunit C